MIDRPVALGPDGLAADFRTTNATFLSYYAYPGAEQFVTGISRI